MKFLLFALRVLFYGNIYVGKPWFLIDSDGEYACVTYMHSQNTSVKRKSKRWNEGFLRFEKILESLHALTLCVCITRDQPRRRGKEVENSREVE